MHLLSAGSQLLCQFGACLRTSNLQQIHIYIRGIWMLIWMLREEGTCCCSTWFSSASLASDQALPSSSSFDTASFLRLTWHFQFCLLLAFQNSGPTSLLSAAAAASPFSSSSFLFISAISLEVSCNKYVWGRWYAPSYDNYCIELLHWIIACVSCPKLHCSWWQFRATMLNTVCRLRRW